MTTIELAALENGAHRNQTGDFAAIPDGWAVIPETIPIPETFPFVNLEAGILNGVATVTSMTAAAVPTPDPLPE